MAPAYVKCIPHKIKRLPEECGVVRDYRAATCRAAFNWRRDIVLQIFKNEQYAFYPLISLNDSATSGSFHESTKLIAVWCES